MAQRLQRLKATISELHVIESPESLKVTFHSGGRPLLLHELENPKPVRIIAPVPTVEYLASQAQRMIDAGISADKKLWLSSYEGGRLKEVGEHVATIRKAMKGIQRAIACMDVAKKTAKRL